MTNPTNPQRGCFIGLRKDQLGARLLMMLNCIRLAEDYGTDFRINWFPRGAAAPKLDTPTDLFAGSFIARHFIDNATFEALDPPPEPLWRFLKEEGPGRLEGHLARGKDVLLDEGFEIVAFPWEDGGDLHTRFRGFISRIEFNPVVARHMQAIETAMAAQGERTIAYHIRRGDILNEAPWKHKHWQAKIDADELYSAYLNKNPDAGALVFSDQPQSIARFTTAHPQVRSIDDLVDLSDCKPVQRDFLELFAMSRAAEIVAPPVSAFSRAAARLSGKERMSFGNVLSREEVDSAYEQTVQRLHRGPDAFITPSEAAQLFAKVSRWLHGEGRESEAWQIGQAILASGADNAFLPLFQAINGLYLCRWDDALAHVDRALAAPGLWQENYVSALAIRAHILAALGKRHRARRTFLRAFWQKPVLPDVLVVGSFMMVRRRLRPGRTLPFDRDTLFQLKLPYQSRNILLTQNKVLTRRIVDLSAIVLEWPYFAMDGKMKRLMQSPAVLGRMKEALVEHAQEPGPGPYSFSALLEARMGDPEAGLARNAKAINAAPDDPLLRKRHAEMLAMIGDFRGALDQMDRCMAHAPEHAFWHFVMGHVHESAGDVERARRSYVTAANMDDSTPELHASLAELCRTMNDTEGAVSALARAAEIAPNQQRYRNRRDRLENKRA